MISRKEAVEIYTSTKIHGVCPRQLRLNHFINEASMKIREAASYGKNHVMLQCGTREFGDDVSGALTERGFSVCHDEIGFKVEW